MRVIALPAVALWTACLGLVTPAFAQNDLFGGLGGAGGGGAAARAFASAEFTAPGGGRPAMLYVKVDIAPGYHIYSITQQKGGPSKTRILLDPSDQYELDGQFKANVAPKTHFEQKIWPDLPIEEHIGSVTWGVPIRLASGVNAQNLKITGKVDLQACDARSCVPAELPFTASLAERIAIPQETTDASAGTFRGKDSSVLLEGHLEPKVVTPGGQARLTITATPDDPWHVYGLASEDPKVVGLGKPTLIVIDQAAGLTAYRATASQQPTEEPTEFGTQWYYEGPVTWTVLIDVPADAAQGEYDLAGIIGYQTCKKGTCQSPLAARFTARLEIAEVGQSGAVPLVFQKAGYGEAAKLAAAIKPPGAERASLVGDIPLSTLAWILCSAFLGGIILNLMPCVLPVIGLKVLSFVEQGGQSRARIFGLNLSYSAGLLSVFLVLASMAAFLNLGWGEQFTLTWFKVAMTTLVFAMALSFLGVWEIPLPGFVGSGKASEAAAKEGVAGAFAKGVFTTILATPCSGPFLGTVFGFTLDKPPVITYAIFTMVGLGMASPYLLIGAAPHLVRWLPKPGAWMDTFKQLMGFVLLGTVVFLFSTLGSQYFIPTLTLLVGIWFACWWIGRTPFTASFSEKATAWVGGNTTAAAIGVFAFTLLAPGSNDLRWQPYSPEALAEARADGKTVLVDFTADWCLTCKTNLKLAINTQAVRQLVEDNEVVPLLADWTDRSPQIKSKLAQLGSKSIPLLAIYPAEQTGEPIVLRDLLRESQVLDALKQAGPSKAAAEQTAGGATDRRVSGLSVSGGSPHDAVRAGTVGAH